jgi:predicted GIY-YIG superfamily endonuclease
MKIYWVYLVSCADGSHYVGVTSNLASRIAKHNVGVNPLAYTYTRRPVELVYSQEFSHVDDAIAAEKKIKGWSRAKKRALIAGDWDAIRRLARSGSAHDEGRAHPSTGSG